MTHEMKKPNFHSFLIRGYITLLAKVVVVVAKAKYKVEEEAEEVME